MTRTTTERIQRLWEPFPIRSSSTFAAGAKKNNRNPSVFFDLQWVRAQLHEQHLPTDAVLGFYLSDPEHFPVSIHPLFDQAWYRNECPADELRDTDPAPSFFGQRLARRDFAPTPFFEMDWYRDSYALDLDPDQNPFLHYLAEGEAKGFQPNAFFDPGYYRD